jgi:type IV secretory pathway TrbF-like protein
MATSYPASDLNNAEFSVRKAVQFGRLAAENKALFAVIGILVVALAALAYEVLANTRAIASFRPTVIRIDDLGNAQPIYLSDSVYKPQAPEVKHFLSDFVTKFYTHKKERLTDYYLSKYYLSQQLGLASYQDDQQTQWVKKLLDGQIEQADARVRKVSITNLTSAPYEALVDFERVVYNNSSSAELRREDLTATIRFTFAERIDSRMIQYNPLGLTIVDFHADQAFH